MPDQPVLYIRGPFPYAGAVPDGLPSDLRVLLQIPREQFERFQKALADYSGFLDQPGLLELFKGHFPDGALGDVIGRIIRFADSQRSIVQGYPERLFDRFTSLEENGKRIFSETEASLLKSAFRNLYSTFPDWIGRQKLKNWRPRLDSGFSEFSSSAIFDRSLIKNAKQLRA